MNNEDDFYNEADDHLLTTEDEHMYFAALKEIVKVMKGCSYSLKLMQGEGGVTMSTSRSKNFSFHLFKEGCVRSPISYMMMWGHIRELSEERIQV